MPIPFLRPSLPCAEELLPYLRRVDAAGIYSNFGPLVRELEAEILARRFGGQGAVTTVANATLGLMLAIAAVKRPGKRWALLPSFTFAAGPLAALWCGLSPYFVDVAPGGWTLDAAALETALETVGDEAAVIIPGPTFGTPMDLSGFERYRAAGLPVVVDAAPAMGAGPDGAQYGVGFSGPVVYSLHATKPFGLGEGGLVYSADADLIGRIRRDANFGFNAERAAEALGLNAKLSEYGAAVGLALLESLAQRRAARRRVADGYLQAFTRSGLAARSWEVQKPPPDCPQFWSLLTPPGRSNQQVVAALALQGIECRTYFAPACHQQPAFATAARGPLPVTEDLAARVLSLPFWETMSAAPIEAVVEALCRLA
ncbi:MAG: DegT/DnrJ/EryC1/StrS family aminotransferase [Terriglobales bacterium]